MQKLVKVFIECLGMPSWGTIDEMKFTSDGKLVITYCDYYKIIIDEDFPCEDGATAQEGCLWKKEDLDFVSRVLAERERILQIVNEPFEHVYDELVRNSDSCVTWDKWDYNFSVDEEGDVFCTPNDGETYYVKVNILTDSKEKVVSFMKKFLAN